MAIKTIPLSRLETDLQKTLNECAESGETVVVKMPDHRLWAIQSLIRRNMIALSMNAGVQYEVSGIGNEIEGQPAQTVRCGKAWANQRLTLTGAAVLVLQRAYNVRSS